jgi:Rrf2 family protein
MLNQTTEHAVRALLYLAQRPPLEAVSAERMALALGAPANYLSKTLNVLARRGLLRSTRGPQGGFRLTRSPAEITVAEVAAVFEEPRARSVCLLGDRACTDRAPCRAHGQWLVLRDRVEAPLRTTTLATLLGEPAERLDAAPAA